MHSLKGAVAKGKNTTAPFAFVQQYHITLYVRKKGHHAVLSLLWGNAGEKVFNEINYLQ